MFFKSLVIIMLTIAPTLSSLVQASEPEFKDIFDHLDKGKIKQAEEKLRPFAEEGDLASQAFLGQMCLYQLKDYECAFKWLSIATNQDHTEAYFDLGSMYDHGKGTNQNKEKAFNLYLKSAKKGFAYAQTQVAVEYSQGTVIGRDWERSAYWHKKAAKNDMQKSHLVLGTMYYQGQGVEKDVVEAKYWLRRATKGDVEEYVNNALLMLDLIDEEVGAKDTNNLINKSLKQARKGNFVKAKIIIEQLANNGNSDAQYLLSKYYRDINGLDDFDKGKEWLFKSAQNENADAQYDVAWGLSADWEKSDIDKIIRSIFWYERSGYNGNTKAYSDLGILYDNDKRNIFAEMEEAANDVNQIAQFNLGWINARGLLTQDGLMQDLNDAEQWFRKAAKQDFEEAKLMLSRNF